MTKTIIRLTEQDLHNMIRESVNQVLNEEGIHINPKNKGKLTDTFNYPQVFSLWVSLRRMYESTQPSGEVDMFNQPIGTDCLKDEKDKDKKFIKKFKSKKSKSIDDDIKKDNKKKNKDKKGTKELEKNLGVKQTELF